jgi:hypothetical protein
MTRECVCDPPPPLQIRTGWEYGEINVEWEEGCCTNLGKCGCGVAWVGRPSRHLSSSTFLKRQEQDHGCQCCLEHSREISRFFPFCPYEFFNFLHFISALPHLPPSIGLLYIPQLHHRQWLDFNRDHYIIREFSAYRLLCMETHQIIRQNQACIICRPTRSAGSCIGTHAGLNCTIGQA